MTASLEVSASGSGGGATGGAPWFRSRAVVLGAILALTVATYQGVLSNPFVLDDGKTIEHNPAIRQLSLVGSWFLTPYATSQWREQQWYRPVLMASYALDHAIWGDNPAAFHATNLVIHLGVVIATLFLAARLWDDFAVGAVAAMLVALHPINSEAVNYLSARSSSLMTLWILLTLLAWERARDRQFRPMTIVSYLFGFLALGTKEPAVMLPVLILVWDRMRIGSGEAWSVSLKRSAPWWALTGAFLILRAVVLSTGFPTPGSSFRDSQNILFSIKIFLTSFAHWVWPTPLSVDHPWSRHIVGPEGVLLIVAGTLAVAGTAVAARVDRRVGGSLVWFWSAIAPIGALPFVSRVTLYQEHRVYLAGIAMAWLFAWLCVGTVRRLKRRMAPKAVAVATLVALLMGMVVTDRARTGAWGNEERLWDDVLGKYPNSMLALNTKGSIRYHQGRFDEARQYYERALSVEPGYDQAHYNLGVLFSALQDWERAVAEYQVALRINPRLTAGYIRLGRAYEMTDQDDLALNTYERLWRFDPGSADAAFRIAVIYAKRQEWDTAASWYERALALAPEHFMSHVGLALVAEQMGDWTRASEHYQQFLMTVPPESAYDGARAKARDALARLKRNQLGAR